MRALFMQETRQVILDILREHGKATVDDIVHELQARRGAITAVTVRHHLNILQKDSLITSTELRRRATPGRPQHMYMLTEKGEMQFPNNYLHLASGLLDELRKHLPPSNVNVILEGVAGHMAENAAIPDVPLAERMHFVVAYLSEHGYQAFYETTDNGYILHTSNCPYHNIVQTHSSLCEMDIRLVSMLLGVVPRRLSHRMDGDQSCSYLIPVTVVQNETH